MNTEKYRFEISRRPARGTTPPDGVDVDLNDALDTAAAQLEGSGPLDSLFSDEAGRELTDLVDRSHFHLAANESQPAFQLESLFKDFVE
jgi:hypothetical protein